MEFGLVEVQIAVLGRQYRGHGRARRWILDKRGHGLALVGGKGCDIHKPRDLWIVAGFGDHRSSVGVADEKHRAVLRVNNAFGCGDIAGQRDRRILDDGDTVAVLLQYLIDALPTGTVHEATVDKNESDFRRMRYSSHDDFLSFIRECTAMTVLPRVAQQ